MSDPKKPEREEDLLEFLGGIDELNDQSKESDFPGFLADTDIERLAAGRKPAPPKEPPKSPPEVKK